MAYWIYIPSEDKVRETAEVNFEPNVFPLKYRNASLRHGRASRRRSPRTASRRSRSLTLRAL